MATTSTTRRRGLRPTARWLLWTPYVAYLAAVLVMLVPGVTSKTPVVRMSVSFMVMMLLGLIFSVRAATHPGLTPRARRPWRLMVLYFPLWLLSGIAFATAHGDPGLAFTLGTATKLANMAVLLLAMLSFSAEPLSARMRHKIGIDLLTVAGGGMMLLWYAALGPALNRPDVHLTAVLYPVGDAALIFGVCTVLMRGVTPASRRPVFILMLSAVSLLVPDMVMTLGALGGDVTVPPWMVVLLFTPIFLMAASAAEQCRLAGNPAGPAKAAPITGRLHGPTLLPYLALGGGYLVLAVAAARAGGIFPWAGLVVGAIVMTLGVSARQIIALRENHLLVVTDVLTGLANRLQLKETLYRAVERSRRHREPIALLLFDLDGFKQVNDSLGHEAGDALLVKFADVLRHSVRPSDTAARLGGDEFAVVLNGVGSEADAIHVAERILEALRDNEVTIHDRSIRIRASVGIAIVDLAAEQRSDWERELLHRADLAMYAAKRKRTHGWQLYVDGALEVDRDTEQLREDLNRAVDAGELRVLYQPIVALDTGDLIAVEALVRWHHPTRGLLAPNVFIPIAEESGAIHDLGAWVLATAASQVRTWQDMLPEGRSLYLSVNFSPLQLERDNLAEEVLQILEAAGLRASDLVLEVTESALVNDRSAVPQLEALRAHGVRVALDDFGTGYSSLRYLTRLPVDILKLDRCFVADLNGAPDGSAVAEAVIRLGQILHLDTVAEGIEHPDQASELALLGCRNAQGYHFARPLAADAVEQLLGDAAWPTLPHPRPESAVLSNVDAMH